MNKEKQIEEMALTDVDILANDINQHCPDLAENYCGGTHCVACLANALTEKGYRKSEEVALEVIDKFRDAIMDTFLSMCNYNDYNKINLLQIGDAIDSIYDSHIAELKKKYTEDGE